ncbi:MAG: hypothetical protein ABI789_03935 [Usitatibacter sp.]
MIEAPDGAADARRWKHAAFALAILAAAWSAWAFAPILRGYFLSDDFVPLVLFRKWQDEGRLAEALAAKFVSSLDAGDSHFYRPLSYLSFAINYLASGVEAGPWMATNVALHVLNAIMAGAIGMQAAAEKPDARALAAGIVGAALFLFFPPGVEVLAWISGRFDITATFFTLLACLAFLRSRRFGDWASIASLAAAQAAFLCKESAAIVPIAIVILARLRPDALEAPTRARRWIAALRHAAPWLALAAFYLVSRYLMFGSFTRVYANTQPLSALFSGAYLGEVANALPPWLSAQFRPHYRYPFLVALTVLQLAIIVFARPRERRAREALFASGALLALTLVLLAPHVGKLPEEGLGGRLLYQSAVFYAVLAAVALRHSRLAYLLWGVTLAALLLHAAFQHHAIARWSVAYAEMRELVAEVERLDRRLAPGEYALVLVPGDIDDIPFARNAQGGLMLPPVFSRSMSARLLVQQYDEVPLLPGKIETGVVSTLKVRSVFDYLGGKRIVTTPPEYPSDVLCFASDRHRLVPLAVAPAATPQAWAGAVQAALDASPCVTRMPHTR